MNGIRRSLLAALTVLARGPRAPSMQPRLRERLTKMPTRRWQGSMPYSPTLASCEACQGDSNGWAIESGPVLVIDKGAAASMTSTTLTQVVDAFSVWTTRPDSWAWSSKVRK
jgi:hypothetical protein